jgi:GNAT superfamily N-acetyltransferase
MIREGTPDDVPRAAAMRQRAWPDQILTAEGMRHDLESTPARAERAVFAYEEDGEILGWASAGRAYWQETPGAGWLAIAVDPARRGEGIATALAEVADAHLDRLGIRSTRGGSLDEPAARALANRLGFAVLTAATVSAVDPRTFDPLPIPEDVDLVPFRELDDPKPIYELDMEASRDIPHEDFDAVELDEWVKEYWKTPIIDQDASFAAYVDGELAGVTFIRVDAPSGRAQNNLTGVRRAFRGRGLAFLMKSHSLRRAAELGATIALTDNDEGNAPMLAVNTKLGYRAFSRRLEWERVRDAR